MRGHFLGTTTADFHADRGDSPVRIIKVTRRDKCWRSFFNFFYYVHITSSKRIRKDSGTETRTNVTTNEQALHRDAAVMVGH